MMTEGMFQYNKEMLLDMLKSYSFKKGAFTLSSGKKSDYFIDCKRTLLQGPGHFITGRLVSKLIQDISDKEKAVIHNVAGVALGGCSIASAVASLGRFYGYKDKNALYIRKEKKDHGTQNLIEGFYIEGENVILLEDTLTTGGSSIIALSNLKNSGLNPIAVISIVNRLEGGAENIEKNFNIPVVSLFTIKDFI